MKRILILLVMALPFVAGAQVNTKESCTSIMVGKRASTDGSVITSHTCDGRYRTWMTVEPAADHKKGTKHVVRKGTMHTLTPSDTTGVRVAGAIAEVKEAKGLASDSVVENSPDGLPAQGAGAADSNAAAY